MIGAGLNVVLTSICEFSPLLAGLILGGCWQIFVLFGIHGVLTIFAFMDLLAGNPSQLLAFSYGASFATCGVLMLSATVTGEILGRYESAMAVMPVLITFIPMLMGTGGNCGSQSSTLVIRGIAVGEIEFKDIFRVIFKEVRIALVVSLILAMVNGLRIYIMYDQDVMLAVAIGITMIAVVVMAKTIGCVLPLAAKKIGLDPAIMAAPLITTILDTCTILVYFRIVTAFFHI